MESAALYPWLALVVLALAYAYRGKAVAGTTSIHAIGSAVLLALVLGGLAFALPAPYDPEPLRALAVGVVVGAAYLGGTRRLGLTLSPAATLGGGTLLASLALIGIPAVSGIEALAGIGGAALGAWILSRGSEGEGLEMLAIAVPLVILGLVLGEKQAGLALLLGLMMAVGALVANAIGRSEGIAKRAPGLGIALVALGGALAVLQIPMAQGLLTFVGTAFVALIVAGLVSDNRGLLVVFGPVLFLAIATLAFGLDRTLGMTVAYLGAAGAAIVLRAPRVLLAAAPLAGVVAYRAFRQQFTEVTRAFDIAQHYSMLGFIAGILLVLLLVEWRRQADSPWGSVLAAILALTVMLGMGAAFVVLDAKGAIGLVVGFGMAPVIALLRSHEPDDSAALALGAGALAVPVFAVMGLSTELSRADKVAFLYVAGTLLALLGLVLWVGAARIAPRTS